MSVKHKKDVKVIRDGTFISKAFIRKGTYGVGGLVFEFSDGFRISFIGTNGGPNTDPITILEGENCGYGPVGGGVTEYGIKHCAEIKKNGVIVVDMPEGFDKMLFKYNNEPDKVGYSVKQLYFYKNNESLGGYKYDGNCCHTTTELTLPKGQIANGFFIQQYEYANHSPYIFPRELYGTTVPNTKPIDGGWGKWGSWTDCLIQEDGEAQKKRLRECNNPAPQYGGKPCFGSKFQLENCVISPEPTIDETDGVLTVSSDHSTISQSAKTAESSSTIVSVSGSETYTDEEDQNYMWILLIVFVFLILGLGLAHRVRSSKKLTRKDDEDSISSDYVI